MKKNYNILLIAFTILISLSCDRQEETIQPTACFTVSNDHIFVDELITFTDCSEEALTYSWDFGDNTVSDKAEPGHNYSEPGEYLVILKVTNKELKSETNKKIYVAAKTVNVTVTTDAIKNITFNSAIGGGNVTIDGEGSITSKGICWATSENPTVSANQTQAAPGVGSFTNSKMEDLKEKTKYWVRAWAISSSQTTPTYGNNVVFTTLAKPALKLTTAEPTEITINSAKCGGTITDKGLSPITERGICWSNTANPTITNSKMPITTTSTTFSGIIAGLTPNTDYHVKAYAINSEGVAYGADKVFKTLKPLIPTAKIYRTTTAPIIDGVADNLWNTVAANEIGVPFLAEKVSMVNSLLPTWKALWDDNYVYFLITVPDDNFYPGYESGVESWFSDRADIYFDVNEVKLDGFGPAAGASGHFLFAPDFNQNTSGLTPIGYPYEFKVTNDANYRCEYAIPIANMVDKNGTKFNPKTRPIIGFDVNIIDLDEAGKGGSTVMARVNWFNDVLIGDSWNNMDGCGTLNFVNSAQ